LSMCMSVLMSDPTLRWYRARRLAVQCTVYPSYYNVTKFKWRNKIWVRYSW
jgi:hypothetical protein